MGLFGAPEVSVIVGEEVHVSVLKALSMLGLVRDRVVRVAVDGQGRIQANLMPPISGPTIICNLIEGCCIHAAKFAEGLGAAGYQVLNEVVLNQVLVKFGSDEQTRRVIRHVQQDGTCWCGETKCQ